jgi:hypothetical protein
MAIAVLHENRDLAAKIMEIATIVDLNKLMMKKKINLMKIVIKNGLYFLNLGKLKNSKISTKKSLKENLLKHKVYWIKNCPTWTVFFLNIY